MKSRFFIAALLAALLVFCTTGCRTRYVQVPTVRIDSICTTLLKRDSIVQRDSVYIVERGDTVFKTKYKYIYRDRVRVDTLISVKKDTVAQIVEVEKRISFWQRTKMEFGGVALWLVPLLVLVCIFIARKR